MENSTLYTIGAAEELRRLSAGEIETRQLSLLQRHLRHAATIPFYHKRFRQCGLDIDGIRSVRDIAVIPPTCREDLDRFPEQFGSRNRHSVRDIALTSGTTGRVVEVPYTEADLERVFFNEMVAYHSAGVCVGDRVLLTATLDRCFIAGLAYYHGVVRLGASAIRGGPGQFPWQWQLINQLKPRVLVGVPTFLYELGQWGAANGFAPPASSVEILITIGEPGRSPDLSPNILGRKLIDIWSARLHSSYGSTEMETGFGECRMGCGGHIHPELMIVEILDEYGNAVPPGEAGEVVATPLGVEGFPLVRFRTGDIARLHTTPCGCGWNTPRIGPIEGRLCQRLKYKGTVFYPEAVFNALQRIPHHGACIEVREDHAGADIVTVIIGCDGCRDPQQFSDALQAHLRVRPRVEIRSVAEVQQKMTADGGRKPRKFFDLRGGSVD